MPTFAEREAARAAGRCQECLRRRAEGRKLYCGPCRKARRKRRLREAGLCGSCGLFAGWGNLYCEPCGARQRFLTSRKHLRHKQEALAAYGGARCACCGEDEIVFLSLDHVNDDGAEHRRALASQGVCTGNGFYLWLKRQGYPPGLRVLCMNCNCGRARNGGVCPHEARRQKGAA